jgi:hypothetical protein
MRSVALTPANQKPRTGVVPAGSSLVLSSPPGGSTPPALRNFLISVLWLRCTFRPRQRTCTMERACESPSFPPGGTGIFSIGGRKEPRGLTGRKAGDMGHGMLIIQIVKIAVVLALCLRLTDLVHLMHHAYAARRQARSRSSISARRPRRMRPLSSPGANRTSAVRLCHNPT